MEEKRDVLDEEDNEFGFDEDFLFEATNNYDATDYNFFDWLVRSNVDIANISASLILNILSEVNEYFTNECDDQITKFTVEHIINCWLYIYAKTNQDELKDMCHELICDDDDNTDDENEIEGLQ
jgi:hypothetical protein